MKEERESRGLRLRVRDHHFGTGVWAEERCPQAVFGRADAIGEVLVLGQAFDELKDQWHVAFRRRLDAKVDGTSRDRRCCYIHRVLLRSADASIIASSRFRRVSSFLAVMIHIVTSR